MLGEQPQGLAVGNVKDRSHIRRRRGDD